MNWLREHMKQIIWITVFAFLLTIFASWGMGYLNQGRGKQELAEINGKSITTEEYHQIVDRLRKSRQKNRTGRLSEEEINEIRQQAFKQLVNQTLLQQEAQRYGAKATAREIRQMVASRPMFRNKQGKFQRQRFQLFLRKISAEQRKKLERQERQRLESSRFQNLLQSHLALTDTEINNSLKRGLREVKLFGIFLDPEEYIDEQRIKTYYEENERGFMAPPRAHLYQLQLSVPPDTSPNYKQKLQQVKQKLERIRRKFRAGTDFEELARKYSTDTNTASTGGLRGWVTPENLPKKLARKAFGLKPNTLSKLVSANNKYYLLYTDRPIKRERKKLSVVRDKIKKRLLADTHWTRAKNEAQSLYEKIKHAKQPLEKLRHLAPETDGKTAHLYGRYGWVPVKFVGDYIPDERKNRWINELTRGRKLILPDISKTLLKLISREKLVVAKPVKSPKGYHILASKEKRKGKIKKLEKKEKQSFISYLRREKHSQYLNSWLNWKREKAEIELNVPKSRIGGKLPTEFFHS